MAQTLDALSARLAHGDGYREPVDVLADILAAMRVGSPVAAHTEAHAPWGLRFGHVTGAAFHVVLQGSCWLTPLPDDPTGFEPVQLGPGDVVLLGRGAAHAIVSAPGTPLTDFAPSRNSPSTPFGRVVLPGPGARSTIVCGAYRLQRHQPHPLLRDLPDVVHLSALPGRHSGLRAMVELLGDELEINPPAPLSSPRHWWTPYSSTCCVPGCGTLPTHTDGQPRSPTPRPLVRWPPSTPNHLAPGQSRNWAPSPGCPVPRSHAGSPPSSENRR